MNPLNATRYAMIAGVILFQGCSPRTPQAKIEVIDMTASITPRAQRAALDMVQNQIGHMQRGDLLVLIPITGDAQNDAGGHILRITAPTVREAYDTDLKRFNEEAGKQFDAWVASLEGYQSRTDILGALDAARQELASLPKKTDRRLIVISDFIEDDGRYNFVSAGSLPNAESARELAGQLRVAHGFTLQGAHLCLGHLESTDFARLPTDRKDAIQAFWAAYFAEGNTPAEIRFDGTGILADPDRGCVNGSPHASEN